MAWLYPAGSSARITSPASAATSTTHGSCVFFHRQSTATDLGAMAQRSGAQHLMLTHLIPPLGADRQGPYRLPKGVITAADYEAAVRAGGFGGGLTVGGDLSSVRLPARR